MHKDPSALLSIALAVLRNHTTIVLCSANSQHFLKLISCSNIMTSMFNVCSTFSFFAVLITKLKQGIKDIESIEGSKVL